VENFLLIGLGGFIGANLRYWVSGWVAERLGQAFTWGTLLVNFSGSCLLAMFIAWASGQAPLDPRLRLFLAVGFFGVYTAFSAYVTENVALLQSNTGDIRPWKIC
jgi:CrcB protein